jgi:hypothetical protein
MAGYGMRKVQMKIYKGLKFDKGGRKETVCKMYFKDILQINDGKITKHH